MPSGDDSFCGHEQVVSDCVYEDAAELERVKLELAWYRGTFRALGQGMQVMAASMEQEAKLKWGREPLSALEGTIPMMNQGGSAALLQQAQAAVHKRVNTPGLGKDRIYYQLTGIHGIFMAADSGLVGYADRATADAKLKQLVHAAGAALMSQHGGAPGPGMPMPTGSGHMAVTAAAAPGSAQRRWSQSSAMMSPAAA